MEQIAHVENTLVYCIDIVVDWSFCRHVYRSPVYGMGTVSPFEPRMFNFGKPGGKMKEEAKKELNIKKNCTIACLDQTLAQFVEAAKKMTPEDRHVFALQQWGRGDSYANSGR
jgi:hypothetical protein